jgi:hypothetical protein
MTTNLEETKLIKKFFKEFDNLKNKIDNELKEIKESIETLKEINKERNTLTAKDVTLAWLQFRVDYLTGIKKISSTRFNTLKSYMKDIDLANIPTELKEYINEDC